MNNNLKTAINYLKNYKIIFSITYTSILIGTAILFLPIRFEENDDVVMLLLASGNYTGTYESILVYINPIYGSFVSMLYSFIKGVEWYTILFISFHIISFSIIIHKLSSLKLNRVLILSFIILFSIIELNFLMYLQFTTVATMLSLAGIIMLFNDKGRFKIIVGFVLILFAALIRSEATLLLLMFYTPYFTFSNFIQKRYYRIVLFFFLMCIPVCTIIIRDKMISKEWKEATIYNRLRAEVTDNLNANFSESIYKGVCSKQDYTLLKNFFPNPNVIDNNKLEKLSLNIKNKRTEVSILHNVKSQLMLYQRDFSLLFIVVFMIIFFIKRKSKSILIILYSLFLVSLLSYISIDGLLKNRIFLGFILTSITLLIFTIEKENRFSRFQSYSLSVGLILFSFYYTRRLSEKIVETKEKRDYILNEQLGLVNTFFTKYPNKKLTPFGNDLKLEYLNPFEISKITKKWNLYYLGWMTKNPHNFKFEESMRNDVHVFFSKYSYSKSEKVFAASTGFNKFKDIDTLNSIHYTIVSFSNEKSRLK